MEGERKSSLWGQVGFTAALTLSVVFAAAVAVAAGDGAYGQLLGRHLESARIDGIALTVVDYQALAKDPDYRRALETLAGARLDTLARETDRFAFWVNAYNLLAIKTVVDHYPLDSIKDVGSFFFPVWKKKVGEVAGREYSLDEIEHGILRKEFAEPRVHFALVCASVSCPDLRSEPYGADRLEEQLDDQIARFLANPGKGLAVEQGGQKIRVSSIFKWFDDDFAAVGGVVPFLRKRAGPAARAALAGRDDDVSYLAYDWSLNDAARAR